MTYDFTARSFSLLEELAANNRKEWYIDHKQMINEFCLDPFAALLEAVSLRLQAHEIEFTGGRKTMFRMHRDVRFSKDKSPYKINVSGLLTRSGTKDHSGGIVYVHFDAQGGFVAAGRYQLDAKGLGPIRDRIVEEPDLLRSVLDSLENDDLALSYEGALTSMPRGFKEHAEHEFAAELKLKSWIIRKDLDQKRWLSSDVVDDVTRVARAAQPLLKFISG